MHRAIAQILQPSAGSYDVDKQDDRVTARERCEGGSGKGLVNL